MLLGSIVNRIVNMPSKSTELRKANVEGTAELEDFSLGQGDSTGEAWSVVLQLRPSETDSSALQSVP